jgi:hypothetical protein
MQQIILRKTYMKVYRQIYEIISLLISTVKTAKQNEK